MSSSVCLLFATIWAISTVFCSLQIDEKSTDAAESPSSSESPSCENQQDKCGKRVLDGDVNEREDGDKSAESANKKACSSQEESVSLAAASNSNNSKASTSKQLCLKAYIAERIGERDSMQDRHTIIDDFASHLKIRPEKLWAHWNEMKKKAIQIMKTFNLIPFLLVWIRKRLSFYGVFDGHAGSKASIYCADHMHKILADKLSKALEAQANSLDKVEGDIKRHLIDTFKQCDDEFLKLAVKK